MSRFEQQPDDLRSSGSQDHSKVPALHEKAKDDQDWESGFHSGGGDGVWPMVVAAREIRRARTANWTYTADTQQGSGDTKYGAATTFEDTDIEGGAGVNRRAADL
ncbi:hypothetical protein [Nocardia sp. NBC_00416]|uniref:hypothetical protein n=1 Tax=Nocardia sp. NBC_00416 TaxID=2975991 RepID=UPI002E1B2C3A